MQSIKVGGAPLRLGAGAIVRLTPEQAKARLHNLAAKGKDVYVARQPIEFKVGEVVEVDFPSAGITTKLLASRGGADELAAKRVKE